MRDVLLGSRFEELLRNERSKVAISRHGSGGWIETIILKGLTSARQHDARVVHSVSSHEARLRDEGNCPAATHELCFETGLRMNRQDLRVDDVLKAFGNPRDLGGGGQKRVFLVDHPQLGQVVLKLGLYLSPESLERARREVSILCRLASPHFPRQIDFQVLDGQRYLIMEEYVDGQALVDRLSDYSSPREAFRLLSQIIAPLVDLWQMGVVHRDLKPANIMITGLGPVIIDLGIARLLDSTSLTHSHAPFGPCTPNYAAPEQLQNRKREIDHRCDQFCLGIVVAQLILAGEHPFAAGGLQNRGSIPENILAGRWASDLLRARISAAQFSIVERMLAPEPYMRYRVPLKLLSAVDQVGEEA